MYTALYRAYRPEVFDEILGQNHITKILKNQLATDSVSHAYLFCGTRGTGKTTTARILAKGVNCTSEGERPCGVCANCRSIKEGTFMDVIEIDAASNNGVENIRELRESVKYPPAVGRKKVYIVDEVHMLSTGAFNALLKTLEEPPENVMFILATTEPQKLPATILSRCMRLDFKRVPEEILAEGMAKICEQKEIEVSRGALRLIAANAAGEEVFLELTEKVLLRQPSEALLLLEQILADGKDVRQFMKDWLAHYRNLLITKFIKKPEDMLNLSPENVERIRRQSDSLDLADINHGIIEISRTMAEAKWSTQPRILLELCIVKMATGLIDSGIQQQVATQVRRESVQAAQTGTQMREAPKAPAAEIRGPEGDEPGKPQRDSFDCDALWHAIFEEAEASRGSFNLIRSGTILTAVGDDFFSVTASNAAVADYVESNRRTLEDLMEKHTGKRRALQCSLEGSAKNENRIDTEKIARTAGQKLGLNIEIE